MKKIYDDDNIEIKAGYKIVTSFGNEYDVIEKDGELFGVDKNSSAPLNAIKRDYIAIWVKGAE